MQVFIIGDVLNTFEILDKKRLNKQLIECKQILNVYSGNTKAWSNHPVVKSYKPYQKWLMIYTWALEEFLNKSSDLLMLMHYNRWLKENKPIFHTEDYFNQMKRRLYTKNNAFYNQFSELGESEVNWYYVDDEWLFYKNGKRIKEKI